MANQNYKTYYRRNLPHYQPLGYSYFVTFRLAESLPISVIKKLKEERERELEEISNIKGLKNKSEKYYKSQENYFTKFDGLLDKNKSGPDWLKNEKVAEIVKEAIHNKDEIEYDLIAYTIMPNHVHIAFTPIVDRDSSRSLKDNLNNISANDINVVQQKKNYLVTEILRKLKGSTSRECNKFLNRTGSFWQHESYDHLIRNSKELMKIVNYILNNPKKANLINNGKVWKWSYYNPKYLI